MRLGKIDPCSFARPDVHEIKRMNLRLHIDFKTHKLSGRVDYEIEQLIPQINELILDVKDLKIYSVIDKNTKKELNYYTSHNVPRFGQKLTIFLTNNSSDSQEERPTHYISIKYETESNAQGLQWLDPEKTISKKYPYMFSQFQPILARSCIPCQDTPAVKMTYQAQVTAPSQLTVLMGAIRKKVERHPKDRTKSITYFEQRIPIPSYLIAIAVGHLEKRKLSARIHVWSEPELVDAAAYEFAECETMLLITEDVCGPFVWGTQDILVLPPSFAYGGMENPCLIFTTPTIVSGDRTLVSIVSHELCHCWAGNLATFISYEHFWLNEGFCVFLERKITGRMRGQKLADFESILGLSNLQEKIRKMGEFNPLTKLVANLSGPIHPDDYHSLVPYEKGAIFLRYLEDLVGGPEIFEPFLKSYFRQFKFVSIDSNEFRRYFEEYFLKTPQVQRIDWNLWLHTPGMPQIIPNFDRTFIEICFEMAKIWVEKSVDDLKKNFVREKMLDMFPDQIAYFLQLLLEIDQPLPREKLAIIDQIFNFSDQNCEIRSRWLRLAIRVKWVEKLDEIFKMVNEIGRVKYVKAIYQDLYNWQEVREKTVENFLKNKNHYMHYTVYVTSKVLDLDLDRDDFEFDMEDFEENTSDGY